MLPAVVLRRHLTVGPQVLAAVRIRIAGRHVVGRVDGHAAVVHLSAVLHLERVVAVLAAGIDDGPAVGGAGGVVIVVHVVRVAVVASVNLLLAVWRVSASS